MLSVLPKANPMRNLSINERINSAHEVFKTGGANAPSGGGIFDGLTNFFSGLANTSLNIWKTKTQFDIEKSRAKAQHRAVQPTSTTRVASSGFASGDPTIMILIVVGVVGLLLVLKK